MLRSVSRFVLVACFLLFGLQFWSEPPIVFGQTISETTQNVFLNCAGSGTLCGNRYSTPITTNGFLNVHYTVLPNHCSAIRLHLYLDGVYQNTTGYMGWFNAPSPYNLLPLDLEALNLINVPAGNHVLEVEAELLGGSGCGADGKLNSWGGQFRFLTSSPPTCPPTCTTCPTAQFSPGALPVATVSQLYSQTIVLTGAISPVFSVVGGSLPPGITFSPAGVLSGTPTQVGQYSWQVQVATANCCRYLQSFGLTVNPPVNPNPGPDPGFNPDLNGDVLVVAVQPDGKIYLGGYFTQVNGQPQAYLARLNPNGTLDPSFTPLLNGVVKALAVLPDGKLLIGGDFSQVGSLARPYLTRLNADGSPDITFNIVYSLDNGFVTFVRQADGKIVVVGAFTQFSGQTFNGVVRLTSSGLIDPTFRNPLVLRSGLQAIVWAAAIQSDGKIVIGGDFSTVDGQGRQNLARLNSDGSVDPTFMSSSDARVYTLAVQPDRKILVGGVMSQLSGSPVSNLGRLNANGTPDPAFHPVVNQAVKSLALQTDGKIVVGGDFFLVNSSIQTYVARLETTGVTDPTFLDFGLNAGCNGVALDAEGNVLAGGGFTQVGGLSRNHMVRIKIPSTVSQQITFNSSTNTVTWQRSGNGPDFWRVYFETSTNGTTFSVLGNGQRIGTTTNWQLSGTPVPSNTVMIRGRGFPLGGLANGSGGLIEFVSPFPPQ